MDGFYEWKAGAADGPLNAKGQPLKQPMFIHRLDGEPLAVAGLWAAWKDPRGSGVAGCTAPRSSRRRPTTTMQAGARPDAGDRPGVPRGPSGSTRPTRTSRRSVDLFAERNDGILTMHPVSTEVNNVRNNEPDRSIDPPTVD